MTTKLKPGDRVCFYETVGWRNPVERTCGTIKDIDFENQSAAVSVKKHAKNLPTVDVDINVPLKNLFLLKKKTRVVWESEYRVGIGEGNGGVLRNADDSSLSNVVLSKFIGKRVRIEITEAKPQEKGER